MDWSRNGLQTARFTGFSRVGSWKDWIGTVPSDPGVYVVVCHQGQRPAFLASSAGGHFKQRDPTATKERLEREWIHEAEVLYVGKANLLRRRIDQLMRFSEGKPVGHWGGRFLWQVKGHEEFEVAWLTTLGAKPVEVEAGLLDDFRAEFGQMPFANIQGPQRSCP